MTEWSTRQEAHKQQLPGERRVTHVPMRLVGMPPCTHTSTHRAPKNPAPRKRLQVQPPIHPHLWMMPCSCR